MLLLLCVVLVPSICVLWFMNQAVRNERFAVRQELIDAYRATLVLAQERLQAHWRQFADDGDAQAEKLAPAALFARQIYTGTADAAVCFDARGHIVYPNAATPPISEKPDAAWAEARDLESHDPAAAATAYARLAREAGDTTLAARAFLGQSRSLMRAGDQASAAALLTGPLADERYRRSTDAQGRLLVPNAELMALGLLKASPPEQARAVRERLQACLLDYDGVAMAAPQRRFLMRELQRLFPETSAFPTLAAEDLAVQWIAAGGIDVREPVLRASSVPGVWQFASRGGRIVTLHRTGNLISRLHSVVSRPDLPTDVRVDFFSPGQEAGDSLLSLPAGSTMPGWQLGLALTDQRLFAATANERTSSYVWIGVLVIASVVVLALLAVGLVRRQIALTQLRNDLVANVTHELKTPLSSMRLLVETLLNAPQLHEKTAREYLQLIANENLRLSRLIDNFLMFSRIERNRYVFTFAQASASGIAESAAAAVRERFQAPDCRFDVKITPDLPRIMADADAMVTVLVNLLDNAWKYSGEAKQIALSATAQDGRVLFTVRDNGIGLSPREAKRVFQRFYQVNQHLSRTGGGCGLGLSIVQFIVSAHHGTVRVESEPGRGSTFIVTLPAAGDRESPEAGT
jgi:signal transduction histidine kinase